MKSMLKNRINSSHISSINGKSKHHALWCYVHTVILILIIHQSHLVLFNMIAELSHYVDIKFIDFSKSKEHT